MFQLIPKSCNTHDNFSRLLTGIIIRLIHLMKSGSCHCQVFGERPPRAGCLCRIPLCERSFPSRYDRLSRFEAGACPIRVADVTAVVSTRLTIPLEFVRLARRCCRIPGRLSLLLSPGILVPLFPPPVQPCRSAVRFGMGANRRSAGLADLRCPPPWGDRRAVGGSGFPRCAVVVALVLLPVGSSIR